MRHLYVVGVVLVVGCLLAGCTPRPGMTGPTSPTDPVSAMPTVATPSPSPSPTWTGEQQEAIDAVQKYLQVWTDITQNLGTSDWDQIYEVAYGPITVYDKRLWTQWRDQGLFLVGEPSFTPDRVASGAKDPSGQIYHIYGCYSIEGSYLSDVSGARMPTQGSERGPSQYDVVRSVDGRSLVSDNRDLSSEGTC